jgi:hypothetical protein
MDDAMDTSSNDDASSSEVIQTVALLELELMEQSNTTSTNKKRN